MKKNHYLPQTDQGRMVWLRNFAVKLREHATELGIATETLDFADEAADYAKLLVETDFALKSNVSEWTNYKNTHMRGKLNATVSTIPTMLEIEAPLTPPAKPIMPRIVRLVNNIKNNENYEESIGRDLKIIAPESSMPDYSLWQPTCKIKINAAKVIIKWLKSYANAMDLYVDRGRGAGYELLGTFLNTTIEDNINLPFGAAPQTWTYRGIYRVGNQQVGMFSLPIAVTVTPLI